MHKFIFKLTIGFCLYAGNQAHACSLAPSYLDDEFGSHRVSLSDVSKQAHKIVVGHYIESKNREFLQLLIRERIKSDERIFRKRKINVHFREVPTSKVYLHTGKEEQEFGSFTELENFIRQFRTGSDVKGLIYGAGGPMAGIAHGSDCERFVMLHPDQNYLVYLDEEHVVQASFPIKSISNDFLDGAATLFSVSRVSPEK